MVDRLRLAELRLTGDRLADAVASDRIPRAIIDDALHHRAFDGPPSLVALRDQLDTPLAASVTNRTPSAWTSRRADNAFPSASGRGRRRLRPMRERPNDGIESGRMASGSRAYLGIGSTWMQLLLGPGSLVNTYRSPSIAAVLTATGRMDSAAAGRRIQETGLWLGSAVLPDGLRAGASGYVATVQVRLLHAGVRRQLLKRGWDIDRWGVPINQTDLARTLLDFTYVPIEAMRRLGVGFTADEQDDVYHLFRHVGHLLGLDPDLHFDDHEQATELLELLAEMNGPADDASRALVEALLQAYDELLSPVLHTPAPVTHQLVLALARVFHGRTVGRSVGLAAPAPWASATVRALGLANSALRLLGRVVPPVRDRVVDQTATAIRGFADTLEGPPLYQDEAVSPGFPGRST